MYNELKDIFNKYEIIKCEPLTKGFSKDKKYIVEDSKGVKYILRVSDVSVLEKRKKSISNT